MFQGGGTVVANSSHAVRFLSKIQLKIRWYAGVLFLGFAPAVSFPSMLTAQQAQPVGISKSFVAEQHVQTGAQVVVTIRTIQALQRINETTTGSVPIRIDGRLEDLADKLKKLPFRSFNLLSTDRREIPVLKKELIPLYDGQSLLVRALYSKDDKVGMWLRWQDKVGTEILDTRMHFESGQSMLAGTDLSNNPSNGLVLAIDVNPMKGK